MQFRAQLFKIMSLRVPDKVGFYGKSAIIFLSSQQKCTCIVYCIANWNHLSERVLIYLGVTINIFMKRYGNHPEIIAVTRSLSFCYSETNHMLLPLIRSTPVRWFYWKSHNMPLYQGIRKLSQKYPKTVSLSKGK